MMPPIDFEPIPSLQTLVPSAGRRTRPAPAVGPDLERTGGKRESAAPEKPDARVEAAVKQLQHDAIDPNLRVGFFQVEGSTNPVIRVYNRETGEVVRQIPAEDVLRLREHFTELSGLVADARA